jgi:hypothetical protein
MHLKTEGEKKEWKLMSGRPYRGFCFEFINYVNRIFVEKDEVSSLEGVCTHIASGNISKKNLFPLDKTNFPWEIKQSREKIEQAFNEGRIFYLIGTFTYTYDARRTDSRVLRQVHHTSHYSITVQPVILKRAFSRR